MKVLSLSPLWSAELRARLPADVELVSADHDDRQRVLEELADAQVLVSVSFDRTMAQACRRLELVLCPAAGTELIDRSALPPGVELRNGVGHEIPMAEHIIGALIALRRRFAAADAALRRGEWIQGFFGDRAMVDEVHGTTLGLIGYGRIAAETAVRAKAFGMRVEAVTAHPRAPRPANRYLDAPLGDIADAGTVDALVGRADALVVACELSPGTTGMIDARRLALMRPSAVLINVARGAIVDEQALFDALRQRRIAGAAIDVWYRYPETVGALTSPGHLPFETLDNILMTPHASGWTEGAKERKIEFLASNIERQARVRRARG